MSAESLESRKLMTAVVVAAPELTHVAPATVAPPATSTLTVTPPGQQTAVVGAMTSFNFGTYTDPNGGFFSLSVNWGDKSANTSYQNIDNSKSGSIGNEPHTYATAGTYTATVTLVDSVNQTTTLNFEVVVSSPVHTAPKVTAPDNQTVTEGVAEAIALGSFTDPDSGPWNVAVNWGDGSANTTFSTNGSGSLGTQVHTYNSTGNHEVTVTVTNSANQSAFANFEVTANSQSSGHTTPTVTAPNNQTAIKGVAQTIVLGSFSDPDSGPWTVVVNWGDGTSMTGFTTSSQGTQTQSHSFATSGKLTVTVTVTNSAKQSASEAFYVVTAASATVLTGSPTSPTTAQLSFTAVTGATGYVVQHEVNASWQSYTFGSSTTLSNIYTACTINGLTAGSSNTFRVGAITAKGTLYSNTISVTQPAQLSGSPTAPSVTNLSFTAVTGATGYIVQHEVNGSWQSYVFGSSTTLSSIYTACTINGLTAGSSTTFRVGAITAQGTIYSNTDTITQPAQLNGSPNSPTIAQLSFTAVTGASGYVVQHEVNGTWQSYLFGSTTTLSNVYTACTINGLTAGSSTTYRVGAITPQGTIYSNTISITQPAQLTGSATSNTVAHLSFTAVTGATGYIVQHEVNGVWESYEFGSSTTLSNIYTACTINGLTAGTSTTFRVGAITAQGTIYSNTFSITQPK